MGPLPACQPRWAAAWEELLCSLTHTHTHALSEREAGDTPTERESRNKKSELRE
jgi:hypothetical protein